MKWSDIDTAEKVEFIPDEAVFAYIEKHTEHLSGPERVQTTDEEVIVLCQVKNGLPYLEEFLSHHRTLGVKHFFFLDNGSQDPTVPYLTSQEDVTVFRCLLPFKVFRVVFKRFLINRISTDQWVLLLDIDELFDFPFSESISLASLLAYLKTHQYSTVVTQMLDLFRKDKGGNLDKAPSFKASNRYYELTHLTRRRYFCPNEASNPAIAFFHGGIRNRVFGLDGAYLTKHALFWASEGIRLDHDHWVKGAKVADISAVLYHYKFLDHFPAYVREAVEQEYHYGNSVEYKAYFSKLEEGENMNLWSDKSQELLQVNQLIWDQFLIVSAPYIEHVMGQLEHQWAEKGEAFIGQLIAITGNQQVHIIKDNLPYQKASNSGESYHEAYLEAMGQLKHIRQSYSWRLTAPLRRIGGWFK